MSELSLRALVIREVDFGDHDRYIHVLTQTGQRLEILCRGIRRKNAKYATAVRLFCYVDLQVYRGTGDKLSLRSAELHTSFWQITQSIEQYALGCYFAELATALTDAVEENPAIPRLFLYALRAISVQNRPLGLVKAGFELRLLAESGFYPNLEVCDACHTPIEPDQPLCFSVERGIVRCQSCVERLGEAGFVRLSDGCRHAMLHILEQELPRVFAFSLGEQTLAQLAYFCEKYVEYHTARSYGTLAFYRSLGVT